MISAFLNLLIQAQTALPAEKSSPTFSLEVLAENKVRLTVPAEGVRLTAIANELKLKLKAPVNLSRTLAASEVKSGFGALTLEEGVSRLAPRAYLDYRATSGPSGKTTLTGITLQDAEAAAPPPPPESMATIVVEGLPNQPEVENLQTVRETADAQQLLEPPPQGPYVHILYQAGLVSVRAHDRSPAAIGHDLATRLGVTFTLYSGFEAGPMDLEITGVPLDELARWLPPGMSLLYRREASTRVVTPLRILMGEPPARP